MREMEHAPTLNWARLKWFDNLKWDSLATDPVQRETQLAAVSWFANALNAPDFTNLPKTAIFTAGCDPLRDEGEAYARKLVQGGNEVVQKRFVGVPHPFMHMDLSTFSLSLDSGLLTVVALWQAKEFIEQTAVQIRIALRDR